jgi:hypothetical protein
VWSPLNASDAFEDTFVESIPPRRGTSTLTLILAWTVVLVPAGWGVKQTLEQSLKLFTAPPAAPTDSATQPVAR